jgi:hypothetical protein
MSSLVMHTIVQFGNWKFEKKVVMLGIVTIFAALNYNCQRQEWNNDGQGGELFCSNWGSQTNSPEVIHFFFTS